jgi:hypothetical protein
MVRTKFVNSTIYWKVPLFFSQHCVTRVLHVQVQNGCVSFWNLMGWFFFTFWREERNCAPPGRRQNDVVFFENLGRKRQIWRTHAVRSSVSMATTPPPRRRRWTRPDRDPSIWHRSKGDGVRLWKVATGELIRFTGRPI